MSAKKFMAHIEGQKIGECVALRRVYPDGTVQSLVIPVNQLGTLIDWCLEWLDEDPAPDDPNGGEQQPVVSALMDRLDAFEEATNFTKSLGAGRRAA